MLFIARVGRKVSVRGKLKENLLFYVELSQEGTYTERRGTNRLRYSLTTFMSVTICIDFVFYSGPSTPHAKLMAIER